MKKSRYQKIIILSDEGGNYYDVLYNESSYSVKTVKNYDTSGDKTGIKISKGILNERAGASRNMSAINTGSFFHSTSFLKVFLPIPV